MVNYSPIILLLIFKPTKFNKKNNLIRREFKKGE